MTDLEPKETSLNESNTSSQSDNTSPNGNNKRSTQLTQEQLERMEKNRKRALELRDTKEKAAKLSKMMLSQTEQKKLMDTQAGFYLDEEDLIEEEIKETQIVETPPVPLPDQHLKCEKCNKRFPHSFLSLNFDLNVCDSCRTEFSEEYKLITKTDAKQEFLLKDCDFDFREPVLKFIIKKNPHNQRWGEMKLYLRCQCEQRAVLVHEDLEKLEEKKELKVHNLHKTKKKL